MGISLINLLTNVEKASARSLDADTTRIFNWGLFRISQQTNAEVIQDLPTPRKASMTDRLGPFCR